MNLKNIENDHARIIGYLIPAVIAFNSLVKILVPVHIFVPRGKSKGTIVSGSSVRPSVDTILSPQLLLLFSTDSDETFQLLFPWPGDVHILSRSCSTDFYQSYDPLTIFSSKSCLRNSSRSFQWILVKPSSYCSHDLKRIILYRGHAWPLFTRVMALSQF